MKKYILFALSLIAIACGGDDGDDNLILSKDYLSTPPSLELLAVGQGFDITISANCSWTISKDADWLSVSPMAGKNTQTVTVTAMENSTNADRTAIISVKGGSLPARKITVTQKKINIAYYLSVNPNRLSFEGNGGTQTFTLTSNTTWNVSCPSWCKLSITSGQGTATISATVEENPNAESRTGQITITGSNVNVALITISQQAGTPQSHEPGSGDNLPPS